MPKKSTGRSSESPDRGEQPLTPPVPPTGSEPDWDATGLCDQAQADGVPCFELGRQCETCNRASRDPATGRTKA
jgi:hypothetical protein